METLIQINNSVGPWLSEICAALWFITAVSLLIPWIKYEYPFSIKLQVKYKSLDRLTVFVYLTALIISALASNTWLNLTALIAIHLILYTTLVWMHTAHCALQSRYGDYFLLMAGLLGLIDAVFIVQGYYIHYHVWVIDTIFVVMCLSSLYVSLKPADNEGKLGKSHVLDSGNHKTVTRSVQS